MTSPHPLLSLPPRECEGCGCGRGDGGEVKDAIFTPDQVESLNAYQVSGFAHPFTCGNHCGGVLVAKEDGWHCPNCDYTQDWAHGFMADWSWARQAASVAPWAKIPDRFTEPK